MKRSLVLMALGLASCTATVPPPPEPVVIPQVQPAPVIAPPVRAITRAYSKTKRRAAAVVTAPDVTPDFVEQVTVAEREARARVALLSRHPAHPSHEAIRRAAAAVKRFDATINSKSRPPSPELDD